MVSSAFSPRSQSCTRKSAGTSRGDRNLVRGRRVRHQPPALVPPQLLGREPAHALDEAALDLAEVDRRIEAAADVVQDVGAQQPVLAGERVDRDLRHRGAVGEVEERPALQRLRVVVDLRRLVEPGRRELARARSRRAARARRTGVASRRRPRRGCRANRTASGATSKRSAANATRRALIVARSRLRRLAVQIAAARRGGRRRVRDLARVGGRDAHAVEVDPAARRATTCATLVNRPWPISVPPWLSSTLPSV